MKAGLFVVSSLIVGLFTLASQAVEARAQESDLEAPSGLTQLGPILSWIDNSTTEDGFKIKVRLLSAAGLPEKIFNFEVAAGVTSYTLPGEARMSCEYSTNSIAVSAFRGQETSLPAQRGIVGECEPNALPGTGVGAAPSSPDEPLIWWFLTSAIILLVASLLLLRSIVGRRL